MNEGKNGNNVLVLFLIYVDFVYFENCIWILMNSLILCVTIRRTLLDEGEMCHHLCLIIWL